MSLTPQEILRVRGAIEGLFGALKALTEEDGSDMPPVLPAMAELLRVPLERLEQVVADMRWLLRALQRVEHDYTMSLPEPVE